MKGAKPNPWLRLAKGKVFLHEGDCLSVMRKMKPDNIVKRFGAENAAPFSGDILLSCGHCDWRTTQDSQGDCRLFDGSDDGQLLSNQDGGPDVAPVPSGVPGHNRGDLHEDDLALEQASISPDGNSVRPSTDDFSPGNLAEPRFQFENNKFPDISSNTSPDELTVARKTASYKSGKQRSGDDLASFSASRSPSGVYTNLPFYPKCSKRDIPPGFGEAEYVDDILSRFGESRGEK